MAIGCRSDNEWRLYLSYCGLECEAVVYNNNTTNKTNERMGKGECDRTSECERAKPNDCERTSKWVDRVGGIHANEGRTRAREVCELCRTTRLGANFRMKSAEDE